MVVCLIEPSKLSSCSKKPKNYNRKRKIFLIKITVLETLVNDLESRMWDCYFIARQKKFPDSESNTPEPWEKL